LLNGLKETRKSRKAKQVFVKKLPSGQWQITPTTTMKTVTRKILTVAAIIVFVTTIVPMNLMACLLLDNYLAPVTDPKAVAEALTQLTGYAALAVLGGARAVSGSCKIAWIMAAIALVLAPPFFTVMKWLEV
jgi:hypothetical protein